MADRLWPRVCALENEGQALPLRMGEGCCFGRGVFIIKSGLGSGVVLVNTRYVIGDSGCFEGV